MADEVIIEEYASFDAAIQIPTVPITTQVLDIATLSAQLDDRTRYVRIRSKGTGFWYKFGDSSASAAADTDGNLWCGADEFFDHRVGNGLYIDTAADA